MTNSFLKNRKSCSNLCAGFLILMLAAGISLADHTQNILLTGYWPPTNEMLRKFSTDPTQNPGGWQGQNWQGLGYNIYAYFPEFPGGTGGNPKGNGNFEIDYQDVGSWQPPAAPTGDFWRITGLVHPVAIMSYGQGDGPWEMEINARNLPSASWSNDYLSPLKPTPAPPDTTQVSGYVRHSTLPVDAIAAAVNSSGAGINAWIDWDGNPGAFLCEYMAYHDGWYQSIHSDPCDQYYCMAAGFTHLAAGVNPSNGTTAVEAALRALISQLDSQLLQYTVSGTVTSGGSPLANVTMCGLPGNPVTNSSGVYTAQVGAGWSGVVTPLKSGYAFTQKTYSNVRANQPAQDYTTSAATADTIAFDATSSTNPSNAGTTLSWSHTVGSGNNRVLVVGVVTRDSVAADQIISSVKFNSVNMTAVPGSTKSRVVYSGAAYSSTLRTDLYYMLNPPSGTYTVLITYNGSVSYRLGGAVSLINVKQQAPEAVIANAATATSISTALTVPNSGAWIVDVVGHSNSGSFTTSTSTERWDRNNGNHTGACSTRAVTTPGSNTTTWTYRGSSGTIAHSLAAFAPSETVAPSPPGKATSPSPANTATGIGVTTDLGWTAGSGATSHLVYFGTVSPGAYQGEQTGNTFDTGTMANNTTYYWRVDEKNASGTTTGNVWSFTTIIAAPGAASNPNPAAGATNVGLSQDLSWTAGSGATSHDVYFGTTSPGTFRGNQAGTTFDTATMANGITYYWRIDEKNASPVTTTGAVWSFTTIYKQTLTSSSTAGGNVTTPGESAFQYDNGINANIAAAADAHYHFVSWTGTAMTAGKVGNPNSANTTVTMDGDYTVIANFAIDRQSLTTAASAGGTVTAPGTGTYWYNSGDNANIATSASAGYHFANWTGSGVTAGKVTNPNSAGTTITMDANYAVQANFTVNQYTISASAGADGSVSPAGDVTKDYGSSQTFTATPDAGCTVDKWTVDGNEVQAGGTTYILNDITAAHTVSVTFLVQTLYITAMAGDNGSINPCWTFGRNYDSSQLFIATADPGYAVDKWTVDDNDVQTGGDTYLLSDIITSHTVVVTFNRIILSISGHVVEADGNTPVKDVLMSGGDINALTDANGYYELSFDYGWSGVIAPEKDGFFFEPNINTYTDITQNQSDVNYTAALLTYKIAGYVFGPDNITPVSDVNVSAGNGGGLWTSKYGGGSSLSDAAGYYELLVDYNWSGKVTPAKYAYAFEPNGTSYENVKADYTNGQDYAGTLLTFKISGCITNECNVPIARVMVSADNSGGQAMTDANGLYEVWVGYAWSGTVTPEKPHYTFNPAGLSYTDVLVDQTGQNYAANNIYDLDCDGSIGIGDLSVMAANWLMTGPQIKGDFVTDETVNFLDFAEFGLVW